MSEKSSSRFDSSALLDKALKKARALHHPVIAQPGFNLLPMQRIDEARFWATVEKTEFGFQLKLSTGIADLANQLWTKKEKDELPTLSQSFKNRPYEMAEQSVLWLILHELSHVELGHLKYANRFGIALRSPLKLELLANITPEHHPKVPLCMEMQADHDATEMLLGSYSPADWDELREHVLAIAAMMVLIEREDSRNGAKGQTHPKAATRIFQLLGHLSEMPLIEAQLSGDVAMLPSEEEFQAFAKEVTIPCLFDAIHLAEVAGAETIVDDLGRPEDFFKDLEIAKLGEPSSYGELKTHGAQEWAKLWDCNEALKPILGGHFTN